MREPHGSRSWRSLRNVAAIAAGGFAAVLGSTQLAEQWKQFLFGPPLSDGVTQAAGSTAEIGRGSMRSTVQTVTGSVSQDNSRNLVLYKNDFRVEVVRATDEASSAKQQLRDDILSVLDGLVGKQGMPELSPDDARALGQRLGEILDAAPLSTYQLQAHEFVLKPGTAFFLPGGDNSISFVGAATGEHAGETAITILRNGRESTMRIGTVRAFRQGAEDCRLVLHEVAADYSAATFSYGCRS
jgi:hypothetical protein